MGDGTVAAFSPSVARALEAQAPVEVTGVPARAFSLPVPGERGDIYITGGLHSNYQGNEIDRMAMPVGSGNTVIQTRINHQPNRPPEGPYSGYYSGGGGYIHRLHDGGLADDTTWQPYPGHQWAKSFWHPDWGFCNLVPHPLQESYPNGAFLKNGPLLVSSHANPSDSPTGTPARFDTGVVGYDWTQRRYRTYLTTAGQDFEGKLLGSTGVSDWNNWDQSVIFLHTNAGITRIKRWSVDGGLRTLANTTAIGGFDGSGGNGVLIRVLEFRKYLVLRASGSGTFAQRTKLMIYSEDFGSGEARFRTLTIPEWAVADCQRDDDSLSFTIDRNSRRVFWLVYPGKGIPCRFYVSTFDALETWTQITFTTPVVVPVTLPFGEAWISANKQPMLFRDGYLYLVNPTPGPGNPTPGFTDGTMNWQRAKVDLGQDLPPMTFQRHDYRIQNFRFSHAAWMQLAAVKHSNWALRTSTGEHILCGGDLGGTYNPSMARLVFDSSARGYTFTELLNETQPAPLHPTTGVRQKRPASPDDGAWFYCSPANLDPNLRDRFIYARGGQGLNFASNPTTRGAYADRVPAGTKRDQWNAGIEVPEGVAAMRADGWTMDRLVIYNPVTNGFEETDVANWPHDAGGSPWPHPVTLSADSARQGAFDESNNCLYRFTNFYGSLGLVRYDMTRRTVKSWNVSSWIDRDGRRGPVGRRWFCDGMEPTTETVVDGFGWFDAGAGRWRTSAANSWEHKAVWLDERDGKLYCVSPQTGYLWCYETRGAESLVNDANAGDGRTIPFYPVGRRIPLVGCYPALKSQAQWPPVRWDQPGARGNADCSMNSYLAPFKGGLLWWGGSHHDQGAFGHPRYCFWRRLDDTGPWTVVTTPLEFAANAFSVKSRSINNDEIVLLAGGGNNIGTQGPWPFFWRLT